MPTHGRFTHQRQALRAESNHTPILCLVSVHRTVLIAVLTNFLNATTVKTPDRGGCQKSNTAKTAEQRRTELTALRERFANLQNRHLEKMDMRAE